LILLILAEVLSSGARNFFARYLLIFCKNLIAVGLLIFFTAEGCRSGYSSFKANQPASLMIKK
ncbi:hypothetical protein, partial [Klebsiella aerogenes]|uniref:hypothetical protein n=1 Tax=Klebsiella aerogenes TaxID=548 RepID=UPI0021BA62DB